MPKPAVHPSAAGRPNAPETPATAERGGLALLTVSFRRDYERCRLLCASIDRFAPADALHHLLVDKRDLALFAPLAGPRRRVVAAESVLPGWLFRAPFVESAWASLRTLPVRNWIVQQIVKIAAVAQLPGEEFVIVDSDVFFVRGFEGAALRPEATPRLFRTPASDVRAAQDAWYCEAERLLGLPQNAAGAVTAGYIGNLLTWFAPRVRAMCARIETVAGRPWAEALCASRGFSEYILYGLFAELDGAETGDDALGPLAPDARALTLEYWDADPLDTDGLNALRARLTPDHLAVMVSAKAGMAPDAYAAIFGLGAATSDEGQAAL